MGRNYFDRYVIVDWSAAAKPATGKDSIWIANFTTRSGAPGAVALSNPPTRFLAAAMLQSILTDNIAERIFVGFDFPLGFPAGTAAALALGDTTSFPAWHAMWDTLAAAMHDDARNLNNRFQVAAELNTRLGAPPGPFWGCPSSFHDRRLLPTRREFPYRSANGILLPEYRLAERILLAQKRRVQSVWKLYTQGSVGSQSLTGIPVLQRFRSDLRLQARLRVWPFDDQFNLPALRNAIVFAEVWPSLRPPDMRLHPVKDAAQVLTYGAYLKSLDQEGLLERAFRPPENISTEDLRTTVHEEGWVLGVH